MEYEQMNSYAAEKESLCRKNDSIAPRLYDEYGVKKGLRAFFSFKKEKEAYRTSTAACARSSTTYRALTAQPVSDSSARA